MTLTRRVFLGQLLASAALPASPASVKHLVLLGDSIFDNGSYTGGQPDLIARVREQMPAGWKASLLAVDGSTTTAIAGQLTRLPSDVTHIAISVGGNDALQAESLLQKKVDFVAQGLDLLDAAVRGFEVKYRAAIADCLRPGLPLLTCTVYNGNFPDPVYRRRTTAALTLFNDVILRVARDFKLPVLDLRAICDSPEDYANTIEPSSIGAARIARRIWDVFGERGEAARLFGKAT